MYLNNERGSFLLEHVISMTILSVLVLIVMTAVTAGRNIYIKSQEDRIHTNTSYGNIENDTADHVGTGSFEIQYDGQVISVNGEYHYDAHEKLGEFIID